MQEEQHPIFTTYTRDYLHRITGYSKNYLSQLATRNLPLTRTFVDLCCFKLNRPREELFLLDGVLPNNEN